MESTTEQAKPKGSWLGCTAGALTGVVAMVVTFACLPGTLLAAPLAFGAFAGSIKAGNDVGEKLGME